MIGVIVPAHNEEALLADCLRSVQTAGRHADLLGETVCVVVVLDTCEDRSAAIAKSFGADILEVQERNVGHARRVGAEWLLAKGARWLAITDADTLVPEDWISCQLSFKADAVCGTVRIDCWEDLPDAVRHRYAQEYQQREEHRHIHGANLGVCSQAYQRVGGFLSLVAHEDVALVRALEQAGARIAWTALNTVSTSARLTARARGGFGDYLKALAVETVAAGVQAATSRPLR
ncbi:glycosyltransferase [Halopseudomonas pelagia]|uniref:Glycosyl transferase n=1 Tax=Halopseudomonas pelagia TaxID=553151 RepID=A0AA91U0W8_9GAMM|nr:glycosyltransferase family A protein [Halopseudomonas pelagia]PCC98361.1 glycosyl transferase [Halopseudomonas pelagia]QFY56626.1 glycosyltransferase family 2 protein [Halopseudomonas pelagia]